MGARIKKTYRQVVEGAMRDLMKRGVSRTSLARCMSELRNAFPESKELEKKTEAMLTRVYESSKRQAAIQYLKAKKQKDDNAIHEGGAADVPVFTRRDIDARARELLDKKIMESVNLIVLNREKEMNLSLQRFSGWATSLGDEGPATVLKARKVKVGEKMVVKDGKFKKVPIWEMKMSRVPVNGTKGVGTVQMELFPEIANIAKPANDMDYIQRRVTNDQGHKLAADIGEAVAESQQAIGYEWNHHFSKGPRKDHEALNGTILLYKSSWAAQQGLIQPLPGTEWAEDLGTKPAREINCRCTAAYIYTLRNLFRRNPAYLTRAGLEKLGELKK
ncbi:hypothetical protein [Paraburkholderia sediminicola]|uniref:hypothetical protein n=1 Tax=Paraburkholderia sediminicola TaxID=458836 RepID=UPI0038BABCA3